MSRIDDLVKASMFVERRLDAAGEAVQDMVESLGRLSTDEDLDEAILIIQILNINAELVTKLARKLKGKSE